MTDQTRYNIDYVQTANKQRKYEQERTEMREELIKDIENCNIDTLIEYYEIYRKKTRK